MRDGGEGVREESNTHAHTRHLYCSFTHKGSGGLSTITYNVVFCGLQCGLALGNQWKGLQCYINILAYVVLQADLSATMIAFLTTSPPANTRNDQCCMSGLCDSCTCDGWVQED